LRNGFPWSGLAVALAALASSCASAPGFGPAPVTYTLAGNARHLGQPLGGATVTALPAEGSPGTAVEFRTGADGRFTLALPRGSWRLGGRAAGPSGEALSAFWGGNPLSLSGPPGEEITLAFLADPGPPLPRSDPGVGGRALLGGSPAEGVTVAAYLAGTPLKGPPYLAAVPTGPDGAFDLPLPPGTYDLVARRRAGGPPQAPGPGGAPGTEQPGPMAKGDLFGAYPHNPVTLREGEGLALDIPVTEVKKPREGGTLSPGQAILVKGTIRGPDGKPVPGARALLHPTAAMAGRPDAISGPADDQGRFILEAPKEGRFFLSARERIGAPPESGELVGSYDASDDHSIELKWGGRYEGLVLTMEPVP